MMKYPLTHLLLMLANAFRPSFEFYSGHYRVGNEPLSVSLATSIVSISFVICDCCFTQVHTLRYLSIKAKSYGDIFIGIHLLVPFNSNSLVVVVFCSIKSCYGFPTSETHDSFYNVQLQFVRSLTFWSWTNFLVLYQFAYEGLV